MDTALLRAIQAIALRGIVDPTPESQVRYVCRWYSKTFSTPLHVVYGEIPLEDIFLAFFEERYRELDEEDLNTEILKATLTPEEYEEAVTLEELREVEEAEYLKSLVAQEQKKKKELQDLEEPEEFSMSFEGLED